VAVVIGGQSFSCVGGHFFRRQSFYFGGRSAFVRGCVVSLLSPVGGAWVAVVVTHGCLSSSVGAGYSLVGGHHCSCGGSLLWRSLVEWR
jgi:hypothetical protein